MTQLHDLIEQYAQGVSVDNLRNLKTLFEVLKRDRDKAEMLERAAFAQMEVLLKRLSVLENGEKPERPARQRRESRESGEAQIPNVQTAKAEAKPSTPKGAIEIEF